MAFVAAYRNLSHTALLEKVACAEEILRQCMLCPRLCGVDRTSGELGFCRTGNVPIVSSWGPHFGEERPLVGKHGSGTIFFTNCNLGCIFCQNWTISHLGQGDCISPQQLAEVMIGLQRTGCHNINLVTPTHQIPMILRAIALAAESGLEIPIVYNCGGYESIDSLLILEGVIDIYMPDFKYASADISHRLSNAADYPQAAKAALKEMHRQVGDLCTDERGIAQRGLLVRHLVLPDNMAGTSECMEYIAGDISKNTYLNIMDQYHPCFRAFDYPFLGRRITNQEFAEAIKAALDAGLKRPDRILI